MKKSFVLVCLLMSSLSAQANITCTALKTARSEEVQMTLDDSTNTATLRVGTESVVRKITSATWDGHATGLITGEGFALLYNNFYGCIRNAELTANIGATRPSGNFRKVDFNFCTGGSTDDSICNSDLK